MARIPPTRDPAHAVAGKEYMVYACPFCGGPSPMWADRRGNPYLRCMVCTSRTFGNMAAVELGTVRGRAVKLVWPPANWDVEPLHVDG